MAKTFPVELDENLHKRLKIAAIEEGLTLHDLIVKILQERVGDNGTGASTSAKREGSRERSCNR
ncbi:MAG: hypothetical protein DME21_01365 [Verrucomicrobia bacterium]|nr:MAG: hypothetical protein DME21_01365 [Verrucomicrobiota bacterium]